MSVELIVTKLTSESFIPPIHLSSLTSQSNDPVSVASASFTYSPPSPPAELAFNVKILSAIETSVELTVVVVPCTSKSPASTNFPSDNVSKSVSDV